MGKDNFSNSDKIQPKLLLPANLATHEKEYFQGLYDNLSLMKKGHLDITGANLNTNHPTQLVVTAFIRSTVEKPVTIPPTTIQLLDTKSNILTEKHESFRGFSTINPNQSIPLMIEFPKQNLNITDFQLLDGWSLSFSNNMQHQADFSDLDIEKITEAMIQKLNDLIENNPLDFNELAIVGFDITFDDHENLLVNILLRNGTPDDLIIKQLPLKLYDAKDELLTQGTFHFKNLRLLANTTKPITLSFPATSIKKQKQDIDLSSWSIKHQP